MILVPASISPLSAAHLSSVDISFPRTGGSIFNNTEIFGDLVITGELSAVRHNYQKIDYCFYVGQYGVDTDDLHEKELGRGRNEQFPFASIKFAATKVAELRLQGDTNPYTIFVKSGRYVENNPIYLPPATSIIGDNLRRISIEPANPFLDIIWVNSACYVWGVTFRGHKTPSAAVAFPLWYSTATATNSSLNPDAFKIAYNTPTSLVTPPSARPFIAVSPYIQGCTSYATSTNAPNDGGDAGCGMRIDGSLVDGNIRSMVLDSYTQVNQGGRGIHIINHGYAQLVSIFTIATTDGIVCESGGSCSISTSNSTFGLSGIVARGKSPTPILSGVFADFIVGTNVFTISAVQTIPTILPGNDKQFIAKVPYPGTCFYIDGLALSALNPLEPSGAQQMFPVNRPLTISDGVEYTSSSQTLTISSSLENFKTIILDQYSVPATSPSGNPSDFTYAAASKQILSNKSKLQQQIVNWVRWYNSAAVATTALSAQTYRDSGYVIDAIAADIANNANHRSVEVGNLFFQAVSKDIVYGNGSTTPVIRPEFIDATKESFKALGKYITGVGGIPSGPETIPPFTTTYLLSSTGVGSARAANVNSLVTNIIYPFENSGSLQAYSPAGSYTATDRNMANAIAAQRSTLQAQVSSYVLQKGYLTDPAYLAICSRDSGKWVDAVVNDLYYGVNARSIAYAEAYWKGSTSRLPNSIIPNHAIKTNDSIDAFRRYVYDVLATQGNITSVGSHDQYIVQIPLDSNIGFDLKSYFGKTVNFYARSTAETGSHTFEYIGCGTNILQAIPAQGGQVNNNNEVVFDGLFDYNAPGIVYYTSSNEKGNYKIGPGFTVIQSTGTVEGDTFKRSILTLVTPLTIALE